MRATRDLKPNMVDIKETVKQKEVEFEEILRKFCNLSSLWLNPRLQHHQVSGDKVEVGTEPKAL